MKGEIQNMKKRKRNEDIQGVSKIRGIFKWRERERDKCSLRSLEN